MPQQKVEEFVSKHISDEQYAKEVLEKAKTGEVGCIFRTSRGARVVCNSPSINEWGYCSKHETIASAKNAHKLWKSLSDGLDSNVVVAPPVKELPKEKEPLQKPPPQKEEESSDTESEANVSEPPSPEKSPEPVKKRVAKITRNKWGNYEHNETHIVFDPKSRNAFGVQRKNGDVYSLGPDDVKVCINNGWDYVLPEAKYVYESDSEDYSETSEEESD